MNLSATVLRPEDFLVLGLEFRDIGFTPPSGSKPGEIRGSTGACLIVGFPPQHVAEQAFFEVAAGFPAEDEQGGLEDHTDELLSPGAVQSRLAGASRLVFSLPDGEVFPYTTEGILDAIQRLPLRVTPVSSFEPTSTGCSPIDFLLHRFNVPPAPHITEPEQTHTAIEAPYRLLLSPDAFARWVHQPRPVTHEQWTELWHTRLGSHKADPRVRAVWSPDWNPNVLQHHFNPGTPGENDDPFRSSLDSRDRNEIVHLTSNHYIDGFIPTPVRTERFMLSSLGAWLRVQGDWDPPELPRQPMTLEQWRHDATIGRDQYVRVVYAGFLLPFGHRASLVKVTERKFRYDEGGETDGFVAYLFQRMFIVVRERERSYDYRSTPFRTVRVQTLVTPDLLPPSMGPLADQQAAFWPRIPAPPDGVDFRFHLSATDWEGRTSEFIAPLLFLDREADAQNFSAIVGAYNNAEIGRRRQPFGRQSVAFAPVSDPGDTSFATIAVTFGAEPRPGDVPHFRPTVTEAKVDIPAVNQITGKAAESVIEWEPTYLAASGDAIGNAAQLFARVTNGTKVEFGSTEKSGGLVRPDLTITGVSRVLGPTGGTASDLVTGSFDPTQVFAGVKLLGAIALGDIIKDLGFSDALNTAKKIPRLVTLPDGDVVKSRYEWTLTESELVDTKLFTPNAGATFSLEATAETKMGGGTPVFRVEGELTHFSVTLIPAKEPAPGEQPDTATQLVQLTFDSVSFKAEPGKKVDVAVQLADVKFLGILAFVNELRDFIPLDGFSDPPNLSIVQAPNPGAEVGFSQGIPTIGLGVMTIQNVSLGASVFLPFADAPINFRFAFCERHQPFTLTVSLFGGGGFFAIDIGLDKVVLVEAALEFGASVAINLGVAQGQASIMAGFYFQKAGADFALTGYFRAAGSLSVLGIISVSLVFYLGLSYASKGLPHGGTLWGQASLTVKIEILFFSTSVSVTMEREFAGSDPRFHELVAPTAWTDYCEAFAAYA